ncbi:hypothetical protein EV424DRAFT_696611 [Suillus variegatus]|nr:hypothetical protein EV424DRAFT_696611 [Suillus variegatus]
MCKISVPCLRAPFQACTPSRFFHLFKQLWELHGLPRPNQPCHDQRRHNFISAARFFFSSPSNYRCSYCHTFNGTTLSNVNSERTTWNEPTSPFGGANTNYLALGMKRTNTPALQSKYHRIQSSSRCFPALESDYLSYVNIVVFRVEQLLQRITMSLLTALSPLHPADYLCTGYSRSSPFWRLKLTESKRRSAFLQCGSFLAILRRAFLQPDQLSQLAPPPTRHVTSRRHPKKECDPNRDE